MDFHAFMYVTIGRRHELERGMAGKDPVLYQRMLGEIADYARLCNASGWAGFGIPEHHLQVEGFERRRNVQLGLLPKKALIIVLSQGKRGVDHHLCVGGPRDGAIANQVETMARLPLSRC